MKKKVFSFAVTVCLLTLGAAATAYAQMPGTAMRASIPFAFSVRGKTLPAGEYEIRRITDSPDALIISNLSGHEHAAFETEPVAARKPPNRGEIVFHRYGDSYFLSDVFAGGDQTRHELAPSRRERVVKREMASNGKKTEPETVVLAVY